MSEIVVGPLGYGIQYLREVRAAGIRGDRVRYTNTGGGDGRRPSPIYTPIGVPLFTADHADYGGLTEDDRGRLQFLLPNTFMHLFQKQAGSQGGVGRPPPPVADPKDFVPPFSNFVLPFSNFVPPLEYVDDVTRAMSKGGGWWCL